jgi:hypothetical protein
MKEQPVKGSEREKPSNIVFFNFGNEETYHFFMWVAEGGSVDPQQLILSAYDAAEKSEDRLTAGVLGHCHVVRKELARLLQYEVLYEAAPWNADVGPGLAIGNVDERPESLWEPILALALARIDYQTVAEAMLSRFGEWAPRILYRKSVDA